MNVTILKWPLVVSIEKPPQLVWQGILPIKHIPKIGEYLLGYLVMSVVVEEVVSITLAAF